MDENNAQAGLAAQDQTSALWAELERLRQENAALRQNVVDGSGVFAGEAPLYLLNERCVLEDTLYEPGTLVEWIDAPNLAMVPQNEPAKRAMAAYINYLESCGRENAAFRGRNFQGLVDDRNLLIDFAREHAKLSSMPPTAHIKMPEPARMVPPMPHLPEAQAAKRRNNGNKVKVVTAVAEKTGPVANKPKAKPRPGPTEGVIGDNADLGSALVGRMVAG